MIFQRAFLYYVTITVWKITDVNVEAYMSGCSGGYCFVISNYSNYNELQDQSTAQQRCRSNATQLVEIRNQDIQNSLMSFIRSVYPQGLNVWNGSTYGKRFSQGSWIRLNGNSIDSLSVSNQTNASYAYGYLMPTVSGLDLFASRPAEKKGGFICSGVSNCSGGTTISGQCYKSFTETMSWYDARNRCLDAGGDLASFDYITTNDGFKALNGSLINTSNSYWIGIRREWWKWQNASSFDVKYSDWMAGHPTDHADCLCLSTSEWKWTECNCSLKFPFVCMLGNMTTTSNAATTSTTTTKASTISTITPSSTSTTKPASSTTPTTITTSEATLPVTFVNGGISMPTSPGSVTFNSNSTANDTGSTDLQMGLSRAATIGIGVGVGVGGALVIAVLIAAAILLRRRCPRKKTADANVRRPHIAAQNSKVNDLRSDEIENPYAVVVPPLTNNNNNNTNTNVEENFSQSMSAVYAPLNFRKEPQSNRDGNVIIVPGKAKPSPGPKPRATNA